MLLLLALACPSSDTKTPSSSGGATPAADVAPPEAPAAQPTVDLGPGGSKVWRALDHLAEAKLTLPERPTMAADVGHFLLQETWGEGGNLGKYKVWTHPLPFSTEMPRPNYPPFGAKMVHGDKEIPFAGASDDRLDVKECWYIDRDRIKLVSEEDPEQWAEPARIDVPELAAMLKRRDPKASALTPADFVRTTWTQDGLSRTSLLLPAPASASFPVLVPEGGHLRFTPGLLPDPVTGVGKGDGADLIVSVDGAEVWKGAIEPTATPGDINVDLAAYAGKQVTLDLATQPKTDPTGDDVVFANVDVVGKPAGAPRRIVVVGLDTTRWDGLSINGYEQPTTPELDAWGKQSVRFDNTYAPAPRTRPSFRTAMTGMYPYDAVHAPTIAEYLRPAGFATAGVVANVHLVPRFGFSDGFDFWQYENGAKGNVEVDRALAWLDAHKDEDAFLFVHFMDPHTFYDAPKPYKGRFTKKRPAEVPERFNRWQILDLVKRRTLTPEGKAWIRGAYDEEMAFTSHEVARLLAAVEKLPGKTLTVVHSDHGEEFADHGGYEHNHTLYNELVHTLLWIRPPGGWGGGDHVVQAQTGLVDLVPTLLDFAGIPAEQWPKGPGMSLRPFVDAAHAADATARATALDDRPLMIGHLMFDQERWAVVYKRWKYILLTASGREFLYDLGADPKEQATPKKNENPEKLAELRQAMERASGWPVRTVYRVRIPVEPDPITFRFDAPVESVGIMDPEAHAHIRANLEWGEKPPKVKADTGEIKLSVDKRTAVFTPGPNPAEGALWIACAGESCPDGSVERAGMTAKIVDHDVADRKLRVSLEHGWMVLPTVDEAQILATPASGEMEALESLGYVGGD